MIRGRYRDAFNALCQLRPSKLQAARDLYYIHAALKVEEQLREGKRLWSEMFAVPRNRRAAQSSFFVMFMQQVRPEFPWPVTYCGVDTNWANLSSVVSMPSCIIPPRCSFGPGLICGWLLSCRLVAVSRTGSSRCLLSIPSIHSVAETFYLRHSR